MGSQLCWGGRFTLDFDFHFSSLTSYQNGHPHLPGLATSLRVKVASIFSSLLDFLLVLETPAVLVGFKMIFLGFVQHFVAVGRSCCHYGKSEALAFVLSLLCAGAHGGRRIEGRGGTETHSRLVKRPRIAGRIWRCGSSWPPGW